MLRDSFSFNKLCKQYDYKLSEGAVVRTEFQNAATNFYHGMEKC